MASLWLSLSRISSTRLTGFSMSMNSRFAWSLALTGASWRNWVKFCQRDSVLHCSARRAMKSLSCRPCTNPLGRPVKRVKAGLVYLTHRLLSNDTKPSGLSSKMALSCSLRSWSCVTRLEINLLTVSRSLRVAEDVSGCACGIKPSNTWRNDSSVAWRDASSFKSCWSSACLAVMSRQART